MKKNIFKVIVILIVLTFLLSNCNMSKNKDLSMDMQNIKSEAKFDEAEAPEDNGYSDSIAGSEEGETSDDVNSKESSSSEDTFSNAILSQRKVIRNADVSITVKDFDKSYSQLKLLINPIGYIQDSSIKKNNYDENSIYTSGTITVRIDKDTFDKFLGNLEGLGELTDLNISSEDVTDKYFDIESRLRLIKYEEKRLEEYLLKITDPDTIFKTERRLTEIRHEIESLTGTINKWDNLIKLSTIVIHMSEKPKEKPKPEEPYLTKLKNAFSDTINGTIKFLGELLIVLIRILPVLLYLAIIALICIFIYRKATKKKNKSNKTKD